MTKVKLRGRLGKEFGKEWNLDVKTPKEALHAINVNTDGKFLEYIQNSSRNNSVSYTFVVGQEKIDTTEKTQLIEGPHGGEDIVITPIIGGAGGVVTLIVSIVVAVVLTVVSAMLAPSPSIDLGSSNDAARKDSYLFSGGPQPAKQGKPIPVGYGRMIIYPIPISIQYEYNQIRT